MRTERQGLSAPAGSGRTSWNMCGFCQILKNGSKLAWPRKEEGNCGQTKQQVQNAERPRKKFVCVRTTNNALFLEQKFVGVGEGNDGPGIRSSWSLPSQLAR